MAETDIAQPRRAPKFRNGFSAERHEYRMQQARERDERQFYDFIASAPASDGQCYFIGCDEGLVKIGHSQCVSRRLGNLQSNSIYKLRILATCGGGRTAEMRYHRKFEEHSVGGEWFSRCPEIEAEIERLNESPRSRLGPRALTTEQGAL